MKLNIKRTFTANMASLLRTDSFEGREYLVAPVVMAKEIVMNSLFYPADELSKFPQAWNHKPLVVNHPYDVNGCPISAGDPAVLEETKVGFVFNTEFESETTKLKAEAWFDKSLCEERFPTIVTNLESGGTLEVSTGMFTEEEAQEGEHDGKTYHGIVHNIRPDHLAILPDDKGAMSWEDGAGLPRINKNEDEDEEHTPSTNRALNQLAIDFATNMGIKVNELSHAQIRQQLSSKLRDQVTGLTGDDSIYVEEVYDSFVIFEIWPMNAGSRFYKLGYAMDANDVITFVGQPIEVLRKVVFEPIGAEDEESTVSVNQQQENEMKLDKKQLVDALIVNEDTEWTEDDRGTLEKFDEKQLESMQANDDDDNASDEDEDEEDYDDDEGSGEQPNTNIDDVEEYLKKAPPAIASVLRGQLSTNATAKSRLVGAILKVNANTFTKEQLESKDLGELQQIADLAAVPAADYALNANQDEEINVNSGSDEVPEMPAVFE